MDTYEELARAAYDAYGGVTGHKNFLGDPMPTFDDMRDTQKRAWQAAAAAVHMRACQDVRERMERAIKDAGDSLLASRG